MKKLFQKLISQINVTEIATGLIAATAGYAISEAEILMYKVYIPIWGLLVILLIPFLFWFLIRHLMQNRKRVFKTGDTVSILGDPRPFIVFEYCIWQPLTLKLKQKNGNWAISVQQKFVSEFKEEKEEYRPGWLPSSVNFQMDMDQTPPIHVGILKKL